MKYYLPAALLTSALALFGGMPAMGRELEEHTPTFEAQTAHTIPELSACMSDKLARFHEVVNYVPRERGATLTDMMGTARFMSVRIIDQGAIRQVTAFGPYSLNKKVNRKRLDTVRACI